MCDGTMTIIWYWPKCPRGQLTYQANITTVTPLCKLGIMDVGASKEPDDTIEVCSAITAWTNQNRYPALCNVYIIRIKKEIKNPTGEMHHIWLYLNAQENVNVEQHTEV